MKNPFSRSEEGQVKGIKQDIRAWKKLAKANNSEEVNDFIDMQLKAVVSKMVNAFISNDIENWDQFCRVRGEIVAALYPIQEVRGAESVAEQLREQLDQFYNKDVGY